MGSLRNLGGDRWQLRIYAGLDEHGRQRQVTKVFTAAGEQAARRKMAAIEVRLRQSNRKPGDKDRTVGWLADRWLEHRRSQPSVSPNTIQYNEYAVASIKEEIGDLRLDRLTPMDIEGYYVTLRKRRTKRGPISETTVQGRHRLLKAILRKGAQWGYVDGSIMARVTPPAPRRKRLEIPSAEDVTRLFDAAGPVYRVLLRVYAATGARRSEVIALRWSDLEDDVLTFRRTVVKTVGTDVYLRDSLKNPDEPPRRVRLDAETLAMLEEYRKVVTQAIHDCGHRVTPSTLMFPNLAADGSGRTPRTPQVVTDVFRNTCQRAGVKMRLHDLRHWHASQLVAAGVPITDISARLGHAHTSMTLDVYAHTTRELDHLAADAIGKALGTPKAPARRRGQARR